MSVSLVLATIAGCMFWFTYYFYNRLSTRTRMIVIGLASLLDWIPVLIGLMKPTTLSTPIFLHIVVTAISYGILIGWFILRSRLLYLTFCLVWSFAYLLGIVGSVG